MAKKIRTSAKHRHPNVVSLFSGAMGLDLGLEIAGFRTRIVVEINKSAIATVKLNRPRLPYIDESITKVKTGTLLERAGLHKKDVARMPVSS